MRSNEEFTYALLILGSLYVIPPLAMEWGSTDQFGALVVALAAICEFICRVAMLPLTGYFNINIYKCLNVCLLSSISGLVTLYFASPTALLVHGIVHGMFALFFAPLITLLTKVLL